MMNGTVATASDADFAQRVAATDMRPLLVDFWADWCGPCRAIAPLVDEIAEEYAGELDVAKLDIVANEATANRLGVRNIPLLLLFKDGAEVGRATGAMTKTQLAAFLDRHL